MADILLVDCRGLECPLPIIQVRLALNKSKKGDVLMIYADDETFDSEFSRFCQLADIKLLARVERGGFREYEILALT
jgi:TusA-related sulfurtransferase